MKGSYGLLAVLTLVAMLCAQAVSAQAPSTFYVSPNGSGSQNGLSWANTMAGIQAGIDASSTNWLSVVWVANGRYDTGGRISGPTSAETVSNRVAIDKPITVRSLHGPTVTIIQGAPGAGGTNGPGATRGVYVTNNAWLIGFTVTNGYTDAVHVVPNSSLRGGGIYCGTAGNTQNSWISNCVIVGNQSWYNGGGTAFGTLYDCTVIFNTAGKVYPGGTSGGGTFHSWMYRCNIISNELFSGLTASSPSGGGSYWGSRYNCYIAGNTTGEGTTLGNPSGGGCQGGWSWGCTIVVNRAAGTGGQTFGGGHGSTAIPGTTDFDGGHLFNCVVSGNSSDNFCGVGRAAWASNCLLTANSGRDAVGGSILIDCTISLNKNRRGSPIQEGGAKNCVIVSNIVDNYPTGGSGGAENCSLTNCLVIGNSSEDKAGGIHQVRAINCTIADNSGFLAGGVDSSTLTNCISWDNNLADSGVTAYYSCGAGYPLINGNIASNPLFKDSGAGNYSLSKNSPCINAGMDQNWMANALDLAGEMRIRHGRVDMGAYEAAPPPGMILLLE